MTEETIITPVILPENKDAPQSSKPTKIKSLKPAKPLDERSRVTKSIVMNAAEYKHLNEIFEARREAGLSSDFNNFLRQCVDFAINSEKWEHLPSFGVPEGYGGKLFLHNGFYKPLNIDDSDS